MTRLLLLIFFITIFYSSSAQIVDNYGLTLGYGCSINDFSSNAPNIKNIKYKNGVDVRIFSEKKVANYLQIRLAFGYTSKSLDYTMDLSDQYYIYCNYKIHDLFIDLGSRVKILNHFSYPYILLGLRSDIVFVNKDFYSNSTTDIVTNVNMSDLKKVNLASIIGLGYEFKDYLFFELYLNQPFSYSINNTFVKVRDSYLNLSLGVNINEMIKKYK